MRIQAAQGTRLDVASSRNAEYCRDLSLQRNFHDADMREQAAGLSRGHDLVKAVNYMLKRWPAFTLFLEGGRVEKGSEISLGAALKVAGMVEL